MDRQAEDCVTLKYSRISKQRKRSQERAWGGTREVVKYPGTHDNMKTKGIKVRKDSGQEASLFAVGSIS